MTQNELEDSTNPDTSTLADRLPERPIESKAQIMHDTGDEWFGYYVSNAYRTETLVRYLEIEADRENPRPERIGTANKRLKEMRE
ncbi:hypothetical protein OSG_eHP15_00245 [environmental Halophage eHP-15]|nr:hypothetical protein OSG_eHP15_00245 [environmental Halophage eHP-15]